MFPDEVPSSYYKELLQNYPGAGDKYIPITDQTWTIITNGMAEVTEPGMFHTAASAHLDGIDFAGKTGTAQVMSDALIKAEGLRGRSTYSNVWFVGVVPRRNPHLVVAVLWQHGNFSYYAARIAMRVVAAYVDKQRRLEHNLPPAEQATKPGAPVEVGAVWSSPAVQGAKGPREQAQIQAGHLFVYPDPGFATAPVEVSRNKNGAAAKKAGTELAYRVSRRARTAAGAEAPAEVGAILPALGGKKP